MSSELREARGGLLNGRVLVQVARHQRVRDADAQIFFGGERFGARQNFLFVEIVEYGVGIRSARIYADRYFHDITCSLLFAYTISISHPHARRHVLVCAKIVLFCSAPKDLGIILFCIDLSIFFLLYIREE